MRETRPIEGKTCIALAALALCGGAPAQEAAPPPGVDFILDEASGQPGELATLRLSLKSVHAIRSASFAIDFDERQLRVENVRRVVAIASPPIDEEIRAANIDNGDSFDGNQNVEGWVHIDVGSSDPARAYELPLDEEVILFELDFRILRNAVPGFSPVEFKDLGPLRIGNQTVIFTNAAEIVSGIAPGADFAMLAPIPKENLDDGGIVINIIGEVGFFLRGDSNMDFQRDVSDPIRTLIHLFQGETFLPCEDAADANDDGKVDLSDSVFTLGRLFSGGNPFPDPDGRKGPDPTPDRLGCDTD